MRGQNKNNENRKSRKRRHELIGGKASFTQTSKLTDKICTSLHTAVKACLNKTYKLADKICICSAHAASNSFAMDRRVTTKSLSNHPYSITAKTKSQISKSPPFSLHIAVKPCFIQVTE